MDCVGISLLNSSNFQQAVTATQELWDSDLCILPRDRVADLAAGSSDFVCWPLSVLAKKKSHFKWTLLHFKCIFLEQSVLPLFVLLWILPLKAWSCFSESQFQIPFPEPCDFSSLYVYIRRRHFFVGGAGKNCMTFVMPFFQCLDKKLMFDLHYLLKVWIPKTDLSKGGHLNWTVNLKTTFHSLGRTKQWWLSLWVRKNGNGLKRSQSPKIHPAGAPGCSSREEWTEI